MNAAVKDGVVAAQKSAAEGPDEERELLALESRYCSHGDTVHYTDPPKLFDRCEGSFMYRS